MSARSIYTQARRDWHWHRFPALLEAVSKAVPGPVGRALRKKSLAMARKTDG